MSFFDSEMERSFLKTAKKKGWVKDEPKVVKTASVKKIAATGNVDVDICVLIEALRDRGHVKQAEQIQKAFTEYKKAASEMYKVHGEDGPDLLEMAHPEGDQKIGDSSEGHGDVETLLSAHKKIRDIATSEPKKKANSLAEAAELIKKAQNTQNPQLSRDLQVLPSFLSGFSFQLDIPRLLKMAQANSGPMYNFINIYYNDLFSEVFRYYRALFQVYGREALYRGMSTGLVARQMGFDSQDYIGKVQQNTDINAVQFSGDMAQSEWLEWFALNKGMVAEGIHEEFKRVYQAPLEIKIQKANAAINAKFQEVVRNMQSMYSDPERFFEYMKSIANNGTYKFIYDAINAFYPDFTDELVQSVNDTSTALNTIIKQKSQQEQSQTNVDLKQSVISKFRQAENLLMSDMKNPQDQEVARDNANIVRYFGEQAQDGLESLKKAIKRYTGQDINSFEEADNIAQQWIDWAKSKARV